MDGKGNGHSVSLPISHAVGVGPALHCTALQAQWFTGGKVTLDHLFFPLPLFPTPKAGARHRTALQAQCFTGPTLQSGNEQGYLPCPNNVGSEERRRLLLIAGLTLAQAQAGSSQAASFTCWIRGPADKLAERASPLDSIAVQTGGGTMKLCYSRPSARGRKVMGGLVPFDQPWRLGANEATSINVPFPAD